MEAKIKQAKRLWLWASFLALGSSGFFYVYGSRIFFQSYLAGCVCMMLNFLVIFHLGKKLLGQSQNERPEGSSESSTLVSFFFLFVLKMLGLFAGVFVCVRLLGLDSLALGLGIFSFVILLSLVAALAQLR
ncbi:MAG: hypothetical protein KDD52_03265 [Bdellovibrionales bacterium]|nr:hypothetical protein [Bdellovibrionales bacterium]